MRRNKQNFNSPYAQQTQQYPSQANEYQTQHYGGNCESNFGFFEDKQRQDRAEPNAANNVPHFYRSSPNPQRQHQPQRQKWSPNQRPQRRHFNDSHNDKDTFSLYFHSSMLEDPWRDLLARHQAIYGSIVETDLNKEDREVHVQS